MPKSRLESSGLTRQVDSSQTAPDAFGPYRVIHQIGVGVLGPLFRAIDPDEDRAVAVKGFRLDLTPEQTDRFAGALADVVGVGLDDPAILAPLDAGIERGMPYLVSEYVDGDSVDVVLRSTAGRSASAVRLVVDIADAVDAAHARGIVHGAVHLRDVIVADGRARVTGFGVASVLEHVGFRAPIRRPYAAPELITGRRWGPEADRYAVAAIAYELLTGLRAAGTDDHLLGQLRAIARPDVPDVAGLQQAFRNGLADDPALRPASAASFAAAVGAALGVDVRGDALPVTAVGSPGDAPEDRPAIRVAPPDPIAGGDLSDLDGPEPADRFDLVSAPAAPASPGPAARSASVHPPRRDPDASPLFGDADGPHMDDAPEETPVVAGDREPAVTTAGTMEAHEMAGGMARTEGGVDAALEAADDPVVDMEDAGWTPAARGRLGSVLRSAAVGVVAMAIGILLAYSLGAGLGGPDDIVPFGDTWRTVFGGTAETAPAGNPTDAAGSAGEREWSEAAVDRTGTEIDSETRVAAAETVATEPVRAPVGTPPPAPAADLPVAEPAAAAAALAPAPAAVPVDPAPVAVPADPGPAAPVVGGPGAVYVATRPPGATVLIDGATVGVTPVLVPDVAAGAHRVRIELTGYRPWVTDVTVPAAERVRVGASLQPDGD